MTIDRTMGARLACEFVGTFALVYVGMLSIANHSGIVGVALAHGLTIAVMASATMYISGAQFNPAVTFGAWLARHISGRDALLYVVVQVVAALLAALLVRISLGGADISAGVPSVASGTSAVAAILIEAILTFFLVFVVFGTGIDQRFGSRIGGLAIGFAVTLDILAGGPLTGAAMNPARWLGPALAVGDLSAWLTYTAGPLIGAALAALLWKGLLAERRPA
jgi:aquaporin Z